MMAQEPYIRAELDYRLERARAQFGPRAAARPPGAEAPVAAPAAGAAGGRCPWPDADGSARTRALSAASAIMGDVATLTGGARPMQGRARELELLADLVGLPDLPRPDGRFVLLGGDAGVGKTRLLADLCARAARGRVAHAGRPLPRLRRQRPALPPVLRAVRPARRRRAGRRPPR